MDGGEQRSELPPVDGVLMGNDGFIMPPDQAKKALRRDKAGRTSGRKKKQTYTMGTIQSAKQASAPRRYALLVFRLDNDVTDEDINHFLSDDNMQVINVECMSNEHHYTKSYRIVVEGRELERAH